MKKLHQPSARRGRSCTAMLLAVILLFPAGCGKKDGNGRINAPAQSLRNPVTGEYEPMENAAALTGVYRAAETYRYEGETLASSTPPLYDPDSGKITVFSTREGDVTVAEENGQQFIKVEPSVTTVRTLLPDGTCVDTVSLPMPEGHEFHHGGISKNGVWYLTYASSDDTERENRFLFHCMGLDGKDYRCASAAALFGNSMDSEAWNYIRAAIRSDGTVVVSAGMELAVLDRDLNRLYSVAAEDSILGLYAQDNGTVSFLTSGSGTKLWTLAAGNSQAVLRAEHAGTMDQVLLGPGADYYWMDSEGIHAARGEESVLLLNRRNSALPGSVYVIGAAAPEVFVLTDLTDPESGREITLYSRVEDIDLSAVKVIEVASAGGRNAEIEEKIAAYNRLHPEVRVVLTDAVDWNADDDTRFDRLCFNLANGFYQPDIVLATTGTKTVDVLLAKHLYRDLTPYLEQDAAVRLDDLFGVVRSYFTDEEGGLWGIAPTFSLRVPAGRSDLIGKAAKKGTWTLEEELDFLESRPQGAVGVEDLRQDNWQYLLLGPAGLSRWIDYGAAECHFDREDFGRLLRYLCTLPKDKDEYEHRASFWAGMNSQERYNDPTPYREGKIGLRTATVSDVYDVYSLERMFGPELFMIGYPTETGRDAREFRTGSVCMITSFCSDPDTAWDLIRTFFDDSGSRDDDREDNAFRDAIYADAYPALKSEFERQAEILDTHYILTKQEPGSPYPQTSFLRRAAGSTPTAPSGGEVIYYDRALLDRTRDLLDGASCTPYVNYTPPEIEAIVLEEISAYLGGGADADSCVKHIQSRVGIWLAEHS